MRAVDDLVGRVVAGRYRVERRLAKGGMAALYVAHDDQAGRDIALKLIQPRAIDERFIARFRVEALATQLLAHDNIVALHDFGIDESERGTGPLPYLALELLDGVDLGVHIQRRGRMPWRDALEVLAQIARGLAFAHQKRVVHRDLKPTNVFMCAGGPAVRVKLLDFGIAKILGDDAPAVRTTTGVVLGTPGYIAPERMIAKPGTTSEDPSSDLYSLGVMAWDMLAGHGPFMATTPIMLAVKHLNERAPSLLGVVDDVPDELDLVVRKLLEKDPRRRPPAIALLALLDDVRRMHANV